MTPLHSFRVYPRKGSRYFMVNIWRTKKDLLKHFGYGHGRCEGFCRSGWKYKNGRLSPFMGEVNLYPGALGVGVLSHEFTHAALRLAMRDGWRIDVHNMNMAQEESLCYAVGNMTAQCVRKLYALGVYKQD
jgi:hypothetical protein